MHLITDTTASMASRKTPMGTDWQQKNVSPCALPAWRVPGADLEFQGRNIVVTGNCIQQAHNLALQVGGFIVRADHLYFRRASLGPALLKSQNSRIEALNIAA